MKRTVLMLGIVLFLLVIGVLVPAVPVYADTETLRPDGAGDETNIDSQYPATGSHYDKVDEVSADDDSTYIYQYSATYKRDLYSLGDTSGAGTINYIRVYFRVKCFPGAVAYAKPAVKTGGTVYEGNQYTAGSAYSESYTEWTQNPNTSSAWDWSELDSLQVGISLRGYDIYNSCRCTQLWVVVDYTLTEGAPVVTSQAATNVEETTATWNGNITFADPSCDYRGFVWDTSSHADPGDVAPASSGYASTWTESGTFGTGAYTRNVTGLTAGATYYYRACAHNSYGWDYSDTEQTAYTKPEDPTNLSAIAASSSQIDLTWTKGTGSEQTMVRGKEGSYPTGVSDGYEVYFDTGTSDSDTGLNASTTYYYRAWAWDTNSGYSDGYSEDYATTEASTVGLVLWYQPMAMVNGQAYSTGTATFTNGNTAVTGSGTSWTSDMDGGVIKLDADNIWHLISSVTDATHLTLSANYSGTGGSGAYTMSPCIPDRATSDGNQYGGIDWGSNSNLTVTFGGFESYESTESTAGGAEIEFEMIEATLPTGWYGGGDLVNLPFYDNFSEISTDTGIPVRTIYMWSVFSLALALGFGTFVVFKPMLISFLVTLGVIWAGSSAGVVPGWVIFALIVSGIGIVYLRRQM